MAGTLLLGGFLFWRYTQTRRKFDDSILIEDDERVSSILEERNVRAEVYLNDQIQGPLVSGVLRPLIFLPASLDFRDPELLRNILLHECAHIRRRDNLMKLAALLALCIHWFNPLVWLMVNWISRDLEEACDETSADDFGCPAASKLCPGADPDVAQTSEICLELLCVQPQ